MVHSIKIINNNKTFARKFKVRSESSNIRLKKLIIPFLLEPVTTPTDHQKRINAYAASVSIGYNRTHDCKEFYPQYKQGSFYAALDLVYDPAKEISISKINLTAGDYFSFFLYFRSHR